MRILIVDDNEDGRKILRRNMESDGHSVEEAANGADALKRAKTSPPDMIISDILMPEMDGFAFCREVKAIDRLKKVPFIFYTATYVDPEDERLAMSMGASRFIIKPIEPEQFLKAIREVFLEFEKGELPVPEKIIEDPAKLKCLHESRVGKKLDKKIEELAITTTKYKNIVHSYENLFNSMRDVIIVTDLERIITDANQPALRDLFGYECDEIIGEKTRMLYADDEGYRRLGKMVFDKGEPNEDIITQVEFRTKSGKSFTGELSAQKLKDDSGKPIGNIGIIRDITEHRRLEAQFLQAQKMEAVGQLAGGVAHDFNNILSAIIGYGHIALMKMAKDDPQRMNIEHMLEAADRAAYLTKDLLLFSRKQVSERRAVDLNEVVRKVEKFLVRVIGEDVECKTMLQDRPVPVYADSHQLEQVLMNLATNARDAMPGGGTFTVTMEQVVLKKDFVSAHGYGRPGAYALVTVSDTGKGMDEETRTHIFEPFFTTKEVGKGTGLGLAVVYGIIKQHDGFVNVYSEPGKGTTFRVYLPIIASAPGEETAAPREETPARGTETVLLAEDDESLRKLSRTVLTEYGYKVIESVDGEDAVKKFRENKDTIQLLLFDLIMPKMNGKEAYDEIRKIKPDMKVIFVSGYAADIIRQKASLEDGAHLMYKPMSPMALLRMLRRVLDGTEK